MKSVIRKLDRCKDAAYSFIASAGDVLMPEKSGFLWIDIYIVMIEY